MIPGVDTLRNKLLAKLSRDDFELLAPYLVLEQLAQGTLPGGNPTTKSIRSIFRSSGMISLVVVMNDGKAIETATVGRDSMFGAAAGFGLYKDRGCGVSMQIQTSALRIPAPQFRKAVSVSKRIDCAVHQGKRDAAGPGPYYRSMQCTSQDRGALCALAAADQRDHRQRYHHANPGISLGNAGRAPNIRHRGCEQAAGCWHHQLLKRRHPNYKSAFAGNSFMRVF